MEKVRRMVEGTRHVKRTATVTETFDAVTPRMLKASSGGNGQGGELVQVAGLGGSQAIGCCGERGERDQNAAEGSRIPDLGGPRAETRAFACRPARRASAGLRRVVAPTACYEIYAAWKEGDAGLARLKQERITSAPNGLAANSGFRA